MTDHLKALGRAMRDLRTRRREELAEQKRLAWLEIAETIDAWLAKMDEQAKKEFLEDIIRLATKRNKRALAKDFGCLISELDPTPTGP